MYIIEYVGREGIVTTDYYDRQRQQPRPGDLVKFPDNAPYPFDRDNFGLIAELNDPRFCHDNEAHVCLSGGSVFLSSPDHVSISGGPFERIKLDNLQWTGEIRDASFWNWADHLAGANQGVHFKLPRPVWLLILPD